MEENRTLRDVVTPVAKEFRPFPFFQEGDRVLMMDTKLLGKRIADLTEDDRAGVKVLRLATLDPSGSFVIPHPREAHSQISIPNLSVIDGVFVIPEGTSFPFEDWIMRHTVPHGTSGASSSISSVPDIGLLEALRGQRLGLRPDVQGVITHMLNQVCVTIRSFNTGEHGLGFYTDDRNSQYFYDVFSTQLRIADLSENKIAKDVCEFSGSTERIRDFLVFVSAFYKKQGRTRDMQRMDELLLQAKYLARVFIRLSLQNGKSALEFIIK